jgi:hypothetical protein
MAVKLYLGPLITFNGFSSKASSAKKLEVEILNVQAKYMCSYLLDSIRQNLLNTMLYVDSNLPIHLVISGINVTYSRLIEEVPNDMVQNKYPTFLLLKSKASHMTFNDSIFAYVTNQFDSCVMRVEVEQATIQRIQFMNLNYDQQSKIYLRGSGGAINIGSKRLFLDKCLFTRVAGFAGGAVFFKLGEPGSKVKIRNTDFIDTVALQQL